MLLAAPAVRGVGAPARQILRSCRSQENGSYGGNGGNGGYGACGRAAGLALRLGADLRPPLIQPPFSLRQRAHRPGERGLRENGGTGLRRNGGRRRRAEKPGWRWRRAGRTPPGNWRESAPGQALPKKSGVARFARPGVPPGGSALFPLRCRSRAGSSRPPCLRQLDLFRVLWPSSCALWASPRELPGLRGGQGLQGGPWPSLQPLTTVCGDPARRVKGQDERASAPLTRYLRRF